MLKLLGISELECSIPRKETVLPPKINSKSEENFFLGNPSELHAMRSRLRPSGVRGGNAVSQAKTADSYKPGREGFSPAQISPTHLFPYPVPPGNDNKKFFSPFSFLFHVHHGDERGAKREIRSKKKKKQWLIDLTPIIVLLHTPNTSSSLFFFSHQPQPVPPTKQKKKRTFLFPQTKRFSFFLSCNTASSTAERKKVWDTHTCLPHLAGSIKYFFQDTPGTAQPNLFRKSKQRQFPPWQKKKRHGFDSFSSVAQ